MREQRFLWFVKGTLIQHPLMLAIAAPMYALTGAPDEALPRHSHRVFSQRKSVFSINTLHTPAHLKIKKITTKTNWGVLKAED
jgi:hypothetical protein